MTATKEQPNTERWEVEHPERLDDEDTERVEVIARDNTPYKSTVALVFAPNRAGTTVGPRARLIVTAPKLLALAKDYEQLWLASCIDDPENCTDCTDAEPCMAHAQLKEIRDIIAEAEGKA